MLNFSLKLKYCLICPVTLVNLLTLQRLPTVEYMKVGEYFFKISVYVFSFYEPNIVILELAILFHCKTHKGKVCANLYYKFLFCYIYFFLHIGVAVLFSFLLCLLQYYR